MSSILSPRHVQESGHLSRRRSRAILNELSGRYFAAADRRPGRQKLLDKMYSSCDNPGAMGHGGANLPLYKPNQEVGWVQLVAHDGSLSCLGEWCQWCFVAEFWSVHNCSLWNIPEVLGLCHSHCHSLCRNHRALQCCLFQVSIRDRRSGSEVSWLISGTQYKLVTNKKLRLP